MKQKSQHSSGGKLRGLFCLALAAMMAAVIALNSTAANSAPPQYDILVRSSPTHTAALSGGDLYLWGTNQAGQFPQSTATYSPEPVCLQKGIVDVAVSTARTLTIHSDGKLYSYGIDPVAGASSQKGTLLAEDAAQVAASDTFAAYISKSGALYTWGENKFGQLGIGGTDSAEKPVQVFESGVKKVSLGDCFALALMDDGTVYGWGLDSTLQFGYEKNGGPVESVDTPVKIAEDVQDISTGSSHSCLLKKDGSLWTCGDNTVSQTGVRDNTLLCGLTKVMDGVRSISAGSSHNFAVSTDGTVYAWGYGLFGQLGTGATDRLETPTATTFDYVQIFACNDNTFGISSDGSLYSFGNNTCYRLGKTDGSDSLFAVRILDKDMNYVYNEFENNHDHTHGAEGDTSSLPPTEDEPPVTSTPEEEVKEPEIVSTPFVSGYGDGTFHPGSNIKRAEFLQMVVSALCKDYDSKKEYGTSSFSDIPVDAWYGKCLAYAEQNEIVSGYKDGTFHPEAPITRAEASVIVANVLDLNTASAADAKFTDVDPKGWATPSINALVADNTLHGDGNGKFRPDANITRAETVTMVAQAATFRPTDSEKAELVETFPASPFQDVPTTAWYYAYLIRAVGYAK